MIMPYTSSDETARTNKIPILMLATAQFSFTGMTTQAASAKVTETSGAKRKTAFEEPEGITGSFNTNFNRSAKD